MKPFDLIVIGSGPAGQRGAIQASKYGKHVALIEKENVFGGACIHTGTLPSKALRESIYNLFTFKLGSKETRQKLKKDITFKDLAKRRDKVIANENELVSHQIRSNGVSVYHGTGSFAEGGKIRVATAEGGEIFLEGSKVLIATGSRPVRPSHIPFDDNVICDSDSILNITEIPESLTVVGGGVIGCEYASMFAALGVHVELIEKKDDIIPFVDQEITEVLKKDMIGHGCKFHMCDPFAEIKKTKDGKVETTLKSGAKVKTEKLLYCMGRGPNTSALNLDAMGIETNDRGCIIVDKHYRTTKAKSVYAVGDVIGFPSLASSSFEQGRLAVCHAFDVEHDPFPEQFPYGIYTIPEISTVGKSEEELEKEGIPYEVGRADYHETARGQIVDDTAGLLKICFCPKTLKIHGIHIVGNSASELVHLGQMIMIMGGTMKSLLKNVFNYPTLAEAYKIAAFNGLNKVK